MKKNQLQKYLKTSLFLILLTITIPLPLFSQNLYNSGTNYKEISDSIYENFSSTVYKSARYSIKKMPISKSESESFPDNIVIKITGKGISESTDRNNVIFLFHQSDYGKNKVQVENFIHFIKNATLPYNSYVLFTPDERDFISDRDNASHKSATDRFLEDFYENDFSLAIAFSINAENVNNLSINIQPGGAQEVSPSWLIKDVIKSCNISGFNFHLPSNYIFLYRNNLIKENADVSSFLENEIPAVGLEFADFPALFLLQNLCVALKDPRPTLWEKHYAYFQFFKTPVFISEFVLVCIYLGYLTICLAILSFMIFSKTDSNERKLFKLKDTWYFTFILLLLNFILLTFFQWIVTSISTTGALCFLLKIILSMIGAFIVLTIQLSTKFKISYKASGYYLIIAAAFNLILFSSIDITLIFLFFEEFIIALICKNVKKRWIEGFLTIALVIPFIPFVYSILRHTDNQMIYSIAQSKPFGNMLISLLIFPLETQWSRVFKRHSVFQNRQTSTKKSIIKTAITTICITSASVILIMVGIWAFAKRDSILIKNYKAKQTVNYLELNEPSFNSKLYYTYFTDFTIWHLVLDSENTMTRYVVSVENSEGVPVYGSNFDYTFDGENKIYFDLPDYPCNKFEISFRVASEENTSVNITGYQQSSENTFYFSQQTLNLEK